MADKDAKNNLLQTMTVDRLGTSKVPARVDEHGEPVERVSDRGRETGRSAEDVLGTRETRSAPVRTDEGEDGKEKAVVPKKWKIKGEDLSLDEIASRGLMDLLITQSSQATHYQQKYEEALERTSSKEIAKPVSREPEKPVPPTADQIQQAFTPVVRELIKKGHIEPDLLEAYPLALTGQAYRNAMAEDDHEKMGWVLEWIKAEIGKRNAIIVQNLFDSTIAAVAAKAGDHLGENGETVKGDKIFDGLRDSTIREKFVAWLRNEVDPKVAALTAANMEKFWFAFTSGDLLNFAKESAAKAAEPKPARTRAASDGSPSRPGVKETPQEKGLLDRLTDMRLGSAD